MNTELKEIEFSVSMKDCFLYCTLLPPVKF
jgi:hypothetical protein